MSILIATKEKNKIVIAADSQETSGDNIRELNGSCKLRKISKSVLVGSAGNAHVASLFFAYIEKHSMIEIDSSFDLINYFSKFAEWAETTSIDLPDDYKLLSHNEFLIAIKDKLWLFNNFYVREVKESEYSILGSAKHPVMGCLNITKDIKTLIGIACKVDIYCSEPVVVEEMEFSN